MPDISMCTSDTCPMNKTCYRYMATPSEFRQSYAGFQYKDGKCDAYWPIKERKDERLPGEQTQE